MTNPGTAVTVAFGVFAGPGAVDEM
jgi:hypothetical protein